MTISFPCSYWVSYEVRQEREDFFGVYLKNAGSVTLITHKPNKRQAEKLAIMLKNAYQLGYNEGKDEV